MSTFNKSLIRKAQESFDFETYLHDNFEVMYTTDPSEIRVKCPKCSHRRFKCYVNIDTGLFNCFHCGFHTSPQTNLIHFIRLTEGISYLNALFKIMDQYAPKAPSDADMAQLLSDQDREPVAGVDIESIKLPHEAKHLFYTDSDPVWVYARKRGLTEKMLRSANAHGIYKSRKYGQRLLIPIYADDAVLCSWQARDVTGKSKLKYDTATGTSLREVLWPNVPVAGTAVLVEGIFDAMSLRRVGLSAYATFGKHISKAQCARIHKLGAKDVVLWYDHKDAKKEMIKAVDTLKEYIDKLSVVSFNGWDPELDAGDLLMVDSSLAESAINQQLDNVIDCASLDYHRWCLCP